MAGWTEIWMIDRWMCMDIWRIRSMDGYKDDSFPTFNSTKIDGKSPGFFFVYISGSVTFL